MDDYGPSLEDAQAAMRDAGIRHTLAEVESEDGWDCWHATGCKPGHRPRVIDPNTGGKLYLSRWLIYHFATEKLEPNARWFPELCGDPTCVNPEHWSPKRQYEKQEPTRFGGSVWHRTNQRARPKRETLSVADQIAIRAHKEDGWSLNMLAEQYKVHRSTISDIIKYRGRYGFGE